MKALLNWVDDRTGCNRLVREALFENVPGGARWRYVWGSTLMFCFAVQVITGLCLWLAYSPSSQTAWESVYFIQHEMWGGWFLRGLHHYTAHAMTVLLVLHLMQVVIDGAYQAPREVNFWFGVGLLFLVLNLALTGYLLPWDQKGFWATRVATNIVGITPLIGPTLQRIIIGGADYGHHTLTRFFALHAGVIPGAIIVFIVAHVYLFRRHGLTPKEPRRKPDAPFWPDQVLRDGVACLAVLGAILFFVLSNHGAELGAPADPSEQYSAARPDWYFLSLFQLLKYFPGGTEVIGAIVLPGLLVLVVAAMPFLGKWQLGHRFNVAFLWTLIVASAWLTVLAVREDRNRPAYLTAVAAAKADAERVVELAQSPTGIPPMGAASLLREDPLTQGPKLFARNCASCHRYDGHDGMGGVPAEAPSASDLKGFASRPWLEGLFDPERVAGPGYFGGTEHVRGDMAAFVRDEVGSYSAEQREELIGIIVALSAEAQLKSQRAMEARDAAIITAGRERLVGFNAGCTECHTFRGEGDTVGPLLTGYGSREWLTRFISDPAQGRFYGRNNDRMPAFGADGKLTAREIGLLADWLRSEWYEPGESQ